MRILLYQKSIYLKAKTYPKFIETHLYTKCNCYVNFIQEKKTNIKFISFVAGLLARQIKLYIPTVYDNIIFVHILEYVVE